MEINIKNETQQLIANFNEVTGEDKTKAMVIMSTGTEADDYSLFLACTGVGSMLLNIQSSAILRTFEHLIENGTIKDPQIAAVEFLANLNKDLLKVASIGADHGKA